MRSLLLLLLCSLPGACLLVSSWSFQACVRCMAACPARIISAVGARPPVLSHQLRHPAFPLHPQAGQRGLAHGGQPGGGHSSGQPGRQQCGGGRPAGRT